jgi:hypothetical protein
MNLDSLESWRNPPTLETKQRRKLDIVVHVEIPDDNYIEWKDAESALSAAFPATVWRFEPPGMKAVHVAD